MDGVELENISDDESVSQIKSDNGYSTSHFQFIAALWNLKKNTLQPSEELNMSDNMEYDEPLIHTKEKLPSNPYNCTNIENCPQIEPLDYSSGTPYMPTNYMPATDCRLPTDSVVPTSIPQLWHIPSQSACLNYSRDALSTIPSSNNGSFDTSVSAQSQIGSQGSVRQNTSYSESDKCIDNSTCSGISGISAIKNNRFIPKKYMFIGNKDSTEDYADIRNSIETLSLINSQDNSTWSKNSLSLPLLSNNDITAFLKEQALEDQEISNSTATSSGESDISQQTPNDIYSQMPSILFNKENWSPQKRSMLNRYKKLNSNRNQLRVSSGSKSPMKNRNTSALSMDGPSLPPIMNYDTSFTSPAMQPYHTKLSTDPDCSQSQSTENDTSSKKECNQFDKENCSPSKKSKLHD